MAEQGAGVAQDDLEVVPVRVVGRQTRPGPARPGPRISASGVRSSWLTLAKKFVLSRSSSWERA